MYLFFYWFCFQCLSFAFIMCDLSWDLKCLVVKYCVKTGYVFNPLTKNKYM